MALHLDWLTEICHDQPDYSFLPDQDFDWTYSVYGNVQEILPDDMPDPLGEAVFTTTTMDANLNHCLATGKSLTGCLHFVNKTSVDVGSPQVPFLMCTLEIPQKLQYKFFALS